MSQHTPGPWRTSIGPPAVAPLRTVVITDSPELDAIVATCHTMSKYGPSHEEAEANARLIAAAPELLEALKRCQVRVFLAEGNSHEYELARAAIAKAVQP